MIRLQPVTRENLSARVYRQLRAALMSGQYEPGHRLTITELALETGTSTTPVREAIFRLVADGALEMQEAQLIRVPLLTPVQLAEIQAIRMLLEGEAAAVAAQHATPSQILTAAIINEEFITALQSDDLQAASELNRQFHFAVVGYAEMPLLLATVETMWARMGAVIRQVNLSLKRGGGAGPDHDHFGVLEGLRCRDSERARQSINNDIRSGRLLSI